MNNEYSASYSNTNNKKSLIENMRKNKGKGHVVLLNILYKAKEDIHLTHNVQPTKDNSVHTTLGALYEAFGEYIDSFVEAIFGVYGTAPLGFTANSFEDPIGYLKRLYDVIEKERKFFKESWIQNDIDLFQKEIALALYKLENVKSDPKV
jgi:hypothetical protein